MNIETLKSAAEKATPGPWEAVAWTCHAATAIRAAGVIVADTSGHGRHSDECVLDAAYIAAANPAAVLALIASHERLLVVARDFSEVLDELGLHCECGEADCRTTRLRAAIAQAARSAA